VKRIKSRFQTAAGNMGVPVGRAYIFVPEHILNEAEVRSVFKKMRSE
jgi:hypothetical protein